MKGDTIKLHTNGDFEFVTHGGNFCIQILTLIFIRIHMILKMKS
ncbi:hypothetical protein [Brevibacillus brevis]|nr:hypothetical protein [Lysinibacillus sp. SDF0063]